MATRMKRRRSKSGRRYRKARRYGKRRSSRTQETAVSSVFGKPFTTSYRRRRKTGRSTFRKAIFNATKFKAHYRSIFQTSATITTGTNVETARVHLQRALFSSGARGGGNPFWLAAGGAQQLDSGTSVPVFDGDITLRGGIARCQLYNASDTGDSVRAEIISMWSNAYPQDKYPTDFDVQIEWDPTVDADFHRMGKIIGKKSVFLRPKESMLVTHRFKPQKIDQPAFVGVDGITSDTPSAQTLYWFIKVSPNNTEATSCIFVTSHSLSFSADAKSTL